MTDTSARYVKNHVRTTDWFYRYIDSFHWRSELPILFTSYTAATKRVLIWHSDTSLYRSFIADNNNIFTYWCRVELTTGQLLTATCCVRTMLSRGFHKPVHLIRSSTTAAAVAAVSSLPTDYSLTHRTNTEWQKYTLIAALYKLWLYSLYLSIRAAPCYSWRYQQHLASLATSGQQRRRTHQLLHCCPPVIASTHSALRTDCVDCGSTTHALRSTTVSTSV